MIHVLTGGDDWALRARRAGLLAGVAAAGSIERFDLSADAGAELAGAASSFGLFGGQRILDGDPVAALSVEHAATIALAGPDVLLILRGTDPVLAAVKSALGPHAVFETFPVPTGANVAARVRALAGETNLQLSAGVHTLLVEQAGHDLPRVASVLAQLAHLGMSEPSLEQVTRMLGSAAAAGVPWPLGDALDAGDVATALQLAGSLEPVAVVNYLASRTGHLGRIVEQGEPNILSVRAVTGVGSDYRARRLLEVATRLGPVGVATTWDLVSASDRLVKVHPDPRGALDVLLVRLAALWSGRELLTPSASS